LACGNPIGSCHKVSTAYCAQQSDEMEEQCADQEDLW